MAKSKAKKKAKKSAENVLPPKLPQPTARPKVPQKLSRQIHEEELARLQGELVKLLSDGLARYARVFAESVRDP